MSRVVLRATCFFFFHLLVLFTVREVAAGLCSEDMGTCDANCKANCNKKYPDGEGSCYTTLKGENVCRCYFQCSSKCFTWLQNPCRPHCDLDCCVPNCADLYPDSEAYCDHSVGTASLCQCHHDCPP